MCEMKIRIATTTLRVSYKPIHGIVIWNVMTIAEFSERFVRGNQLVIGELRLPIIDFVQHNEYIATLDTNCPFYDCIFI